MPSPPSRPPFPRIQRSAASHSYPVLALRPLAASLFVHLALGIPIALAVLATPSREERALSPSSASMEPSSPHEAWVLEEWPEELESPQAEEVSTPDEATPQLAEPLHGDLLEAAEAEAVDFMPPLPQPMDLAFSLKPKAERVEAREPPEDATPKAAPPEASSAPTAGDRDPILLESPAPSYPRLARRSRWEGVVLCKLSVSASGHVAQVVVERSSGRRVLDEAAVSALLRWRFQPGLRSGIPAAQEVLHRVTFQLD